MDYYDKLEKQITWFLDKIVWKVVIFLMILIAISHGNVNALELEGRIGQMLYGDSEIRAGNSIELRIKHKNVFAFIERDNLLMYGNYFDIDSIGIGFESKINKDFKFYLKAGYYMPQYDENGFWWEGLYYRQIKYWSPPLTPTLFDSYNVNFDSDFGGEIGLDFKRQIWKSLHLGIGTGYRYLRINEYVCGWNDGGAPGVTGWILEQNRDFGGYKVSGLIEWRF